MGLEQRAFDPAEEEQPEQKVSQSPERGSNVIEFPKREQTEEISDAEVSEKQRTAALEKLRAEIIEFPGPQSENKNTPKTGGTEGGGGEGGEGGEGGDIPFVENFQTYRPCEACGGKGRRGLFGLGGKCPVCKGLGSVPASSSSQSGYYDGQTGEKHIESHS